MTVPAAAFFDFDGTLIDGYSAVLHLNREFRSGAMGAGELARLYRTGLDVRRGRVEFDHFMRIGAQSFRGHDEALLTSVGRSLFHEALGGVLFSEMIAVIDSHRRAGHRLVIASSALRFQVEPLAEELGFDDVLCTELEAVDGRYTGRVDGQPLWGPGKAAAVRRYAAAHGLDLEACVAYGNGEEDIPYLESVGHPRAVNPDPGLQAHAESLGWPIIRCRAKAGRPGITAAARTLGAYGAMAASFGAGLAVDALTGSHRRGVDVTIQGGSDLALAAAGVRVEVLGGEILESARPAVFIFNHQSILDGLVMMKLLRHDITGVGKQELTAQPGIGQFARWAGLALIDRRNTSSAVAALAPVTEKLRQGISIVVAPEGTRMPTPVCGPFKKGAFRMAQQGGVPIVPVVLRGAGDLLWRGHRIMRAGVIQACVLDPVDVSEWPETEFADRVEGVRQRFLDTLARWPGEPAVPLALAQDTAAAGTST